MQSAAAGGVVYHHLNIPDLQNPALLADYGAFNVLEEVNVTPTGRLCHTDALLAL
jgi:hypothetical protein